MIDSDIIPFIDLQKEHAPYCKDLENAAVSVIRSGRYLNGEQTIAFERQLAETLQTRHAVGCSNGLDAIRLIIKAYIELGKLKKGDKVIVPANTYIASILPLTEFGLIPVFVEPDMKTFGLDLKRADEIINSPDSDIKAVMIVHLYGIPCWDFEICSSWAKKGILIIEDNAQSIGAQASSDGLFGSRFTGGLGHAAATSFYPTKNVGALGDAGAVTTNDSELAKTVKALANYGSDRRYHNIYQGYNCRIDEIQAAMLRVILDNLDEISERRRDIASFYNANLTNPLVTKPELQPDTRCVWHQYIILSPFRDQLKEYLEQKGIATDIHYAVPPHRQPCYASLKHPPLPITEEISDSILSLPIQGVDTKSLQRICDAINAFKQQ